MDSPPAGLEGAGGHLAEVAHTLEVLRGRLHADTPAAVVEAVVRETVDKVDDTRWASITVLRSGRFNSLAATAETARRADAIQHEAASGPCVDAALDGSVHICQDLASDPRWPVFGSRAVDELGVRSVLSYRLNLVGEPQVLAALNCYSGTPHSFDEEALWAGTMLATHCSLAVSVALSRDRAEHLERAVRSNREIGTAVGVLMAQHKVTREQAFDLLRLASQDANRKLAEIATEVVDTGVLPLPRRPGRRSGGSTP